MKALRSTLVLAALLFAVTVSVLPSGVSACPVEEQWQQTFYAEPEHLTYMGECHRYCFGWPTCSGTRTDYFTWVSYSCGIGPC